jgi:hypothetical protein
MRIVVVVGPRHGRARLHSDALRKEGVLVDLHLCVRRRRSLTGKGTGGEGGDRKRGHDAHSGFDRSHERSPQRCSGWSMMASRCCPRLKVTSVIPRTERSLSSATFMGPGEGAAPGAGCGKAVDMAV